MRTGRRTLKSTTGLDLTGLFVGSEGMLGIITEITVKLVPAPPPPATAVAYFDELPPAGTAIAEIFDQGLEPSMLEIIDRTSLRQVEAVYRMDLDTEAACLLLIQTSGDGSAEAISDIAAICAANGASFVHHIDDPAEGDMLIEVRRRIGGAMDKAGKSWLPEDVAVPRERLAELLAGITAIGERHGIDIPTIGHAGDGNLHPLLMFDASDPTELATAKAAFAEIITLALELGGTMAAEHGVGTLKRPFLEAELDPAQLAAQRAVRRALDPDGLFNPGKAL
jgi:glycolate oxidase